MERSGWGRCVCAGGSEGVGQPLSDLLAFAFCSESAWQSKTDRKKVLRKADFSCQEGLAIKRAELVAGAGTLLNWSARLLPAPKFSHLL